MPGDFCCGQQQVWCVRGDYCSYFAVGFVYTSLACINISTTAFCLVPLFGYDNPVGVAHLVWFQTICALVLASHLGASLADPGVVARAADAELLTQFTLELAELEKTASDLEVRKFKRAFCKRCRVPKPPGAHHCSTCNRCVHAMDHHCPWINNCVGQRNLKMFLLFLFYTTLGTGYAVGMHGWRLYGLIMHNALRAKIDVADRNFYLGLIAFCVVSGLAAVFFFVFVLCMCSDQHDALTTGVPGVDSLSYQDDIPWKQSVCKGFTSIAQRGERFSWRWFAPVAAIPPTSGEEDDDDKKDK